MAIEYSPMTLAWSNQQVVKYKQSNSCRCKKSSNDLWCITLSKGKTSNGMKHGKMLYTEDKSSIMQIKVDSQ